MTAPVIEARSLSSLTSLASNPPSYPRNPTHVKHESLVLYIARVPGSRDVFLSPMKPRDKVVTAEDIQNSLYFVHVDHPEDSRLVEPPPSFREPVYEDQSPPVPGQTQGNPIQRKAIPSAAVAPNVPAGPKRKPLPGTLALVNNFQSRQNVSAANYPAPSSNLLAPIYAPRRSFDTLQYQAENDRPPLPPRKPTEQPNPCGTSLTLIRRDPASGAQWNVAHIDDPQILDVSSSTLNEPPKKQTGAPLFIDILNPGYSKFLRSEPANQSTQNEGGIFRRRVWMEGSKYANGGFGHRRLNSQDSYASTGSPRASLEDRQHDRPSVDVRPLETPPFISRDNQSYSTIQVSNRQSTFRGYVFMSPWNGRCEFVTGAGGGSLKCQHSVPGLQGAPPATMSVSELRFNLPSNSKVATPRGEESSKRSSFFHRPRHSRQSSAVSDSRLSSTEDVRSSFDRMDLSLGQEYAGGGFGGKQAKLGKLIIEDEGLKMVDLLVATNVALWWRAYEKRDIKVKTDRGGSF
ncbi:hypothetical protein K458DRAFT_331984 [Lentithecium fluviatile CBS 122367]|uniref:Oxidoreductase-like protein n=1 Tax=Lentithecium fluviatile CBS 122367 TaxID=1168545 RepID=A0A6G1JBV7_9PLEO|nr:hypothetical protein K458DRAFT_331984 [Lentithecium fluviatile CBS 122367]